MLNTGTASVTASSLLITAKRNSLNHITLKQKVITFEPETEKGS